jgi:hypothetical protein
MTYLMRLIEIAQIQRRRNGTYVKPSASRRQCSGVFLLPDNEGGHLQVCKKTFRETFGISAKIVQNLMARRKEGETVYFDKRSRITAKKFRKADRKLVRDHIKQFPREYSHYSRARNEDKEYLSMDLNFRKMHEAFKLQNPNSNVTEKYYKAVFLKDFPKLSFQKPRQDTCKTCDQLNIVTKVDGPKGEAAKLELEAHQSEAERAYDSAKEDFTKSTLPNGNICTITIDLQKVFPLPKLTHSTMFYSRQLSAYNFGIHVADAGNAIMCTWHEGIAGRGGNEMATCLLQAINTGMLETEKKHLVVYSDNCAGQLKNRMLVYLYLMLIKSGHFDTIEHKFLLSGHSYSVADRDFAVIEKRSRTTSRMQSLEDVKAVIRSARVIQPFQVLDLSEKTFFDFSTASADLLNTAGMRISSVSWFRVDKSDLTTVLCKNSFVPTENFRSVSLLPRNTTAADFISKIGVLDAIDEIPKIKDDKLDDLIKMTDYMDEPAKEFFEKIFIEQTTIRDD